MQSLGSEAGRGGTIDNLTRGVIETVAEQAGLTPEATSRILAELETLPAGQPTIDYGRYLVEQAKAAGEVLLDEDVQSLLRDRLRDTITAWGKMMEALISLNGEIDDSYLLDLDKHLNEYFSAQLVPLLQAYGQPFTMQVAGWKRPITLSIGDQGQVQWTPHTE